MAMSPCQGDLGRELTDPLRSEILNQCIGNREIG